MTDDILTRLQCIYDKDGCGLCTFCLAKVEIENLRYFLERLTVTGDAMVGAINMGMWSSLQFLTNAWNEAKNDRG